MLFGDFFSFAMKFKNFVLCSQTIQITMKVQYYVFSSFMFYVACLFFVQYPHILYSGVPSPTKLSLDKQFTNSALISWRGVQMANEDILGYNIYVDGQLTTRIKGNQKTNAVIENIDPTQVKCFKALRYPEILFILCENVD